MFDRNVKMNDRIDHFFQSIEVHPNYYWTYILIRKHSKIKESQTKCFGH